MKGLAVNDLKGADNADDKVKIGDAWWAYADKESDPAKTQIKNRAGKWYRESIQDLSGLAKARVESRLESLGSVAVAQTSHALSLDAKNADWSNMGVLAKGKYTVEITGKVHLHFDEPAFIVGPEGKEFGGHRIGTVSVSLGGKLYDSREDGRAITGGRAIDLEVSDVSKALMKVNDQTYDDNSASYTVTIVRKN